MKKLALILIPGLAMFSLANVSLAQTLYWDGGTVNITTNGDGISQGGAGSWDNTTQNWDQGSGLAHIAWSSGGDALFGASGILPGAGVVTLNAPITANSVTIGGTNYFLTDGGATANTLTVNAITNTQIATLSNNLVNAAGFTKAGTSTLTLLATSPSLNGPITVAAGTLAFGNQATLPGPTSFGDVTIASGATLKFAEGATITYIQNISGAGSIYAAAPSSSVDVILVGNNTFSGSATVSQCTLEVNSINDSAPSALGQGTNVILGTGASASALTYLGYGDTTSRTLTLGGTTPNTILGNSGFGPLTWTGPLAFATTNQHTLNLGGTYTGVNTFGGTIPDGSSTNTLLKINGGTWLVTGTNTYSGGTLMSSGTMLVTNDNALGASNGIIFFTGNATIKSTNANVTLGPSRSIAVTNSITGTFSVLDTNNLVVASYITGAGSVTKGSASFALGSVRFGNDTNSFAGTFTAGFGNTEFTFAANSGTPSSLGLGTANSGTIVLGNSTSSGTLRYVGTANSSTTRPLNWTATTGGYALDVTNTGTIAYLATGVLKSGNGSAPLTLEGSNTGTNTLAQVINDSGGTTTLNKAGTGTWVVTGANTYSGVTTISGGTLSVSSDGNLGTAPGSATPNSLTINGGTLSASASFTLNANRGIALGPTGTNSLGDNASGPGTIDVAASQTLTYGGVLANNTSTNIGGLVKTGAGTLALSDAETYTGNTTINGGTLALRGSGSIVGSSNIIIAAGAALDVSGLGGGYTLAASQALLATNGAPVIVAGTLDVGSAAVVLTNVINTATITVSNGTLALAAGAAFTVNLNNGGTPAGAGSYRLIAKATGGSVTGTAPASVIVGGDGLAAGATASLSISNNELYLVVAGGTVYPPLIGGLSLSGGQAVLSFSGTNGQTWKILTSTNLTEPLTNWNVVTTGAFSGATVNYTNPTPVDPQRFYLITSP